MGYFGNTRHSLLYPWLDSDPSVAEQQDGLAEGARPRNKGFVNWTSCQRQGCDAAFGHKGQREPWEWC